MVVRAAAVAFVLSWSLLPIAAAQDEATPASQYSAIKADLANGAVADARARYDQTFAQALHESDAALDARITDAFGKAVRSGNGSLEYRLARHVIDKGMLHGAYLGVHRALFASGDASLGQPWLDVLATKFGAAVATARDEYAAIRSAGGTPEAVAEHRDLVDTGLLRLFELKVREEAAEVFQYWEANGTREEKAVEAVAYYGPLRPDVVARLGSDADGGLAQGLSELETAARAQNRTAAEAARTEVEVLLDAYASARAGGGLAARGEALVGAVEVLLVEYDEYVRDGRVVDAAAYEHEVKGLFLPAVEARWRAMAVDASKVDPGVASEIDALVDDLESRVLRPAPNADVRGTAERLVQKVRAVSGAQERPASAFEAAVAEMGRILADVVVAHAAGDRAKALALVADAYLDVYAPKLETRVLASAPGLNREIEDLLNVRLKGQVASGASLEEVRSTVAALEARLIEAQSIVVRPPSDGKLFFDSFLIIVREGFEAILVLGAVVVYLLRTGHRRRTRHVYAGAALGLVATVLLYILVETLLDLSGVQREILEGATALLAVAVLFYVSYWLVSKIEAGKWNRYIHAKVRGALRSGNTFALAGVAFLAVFREGFETVLFYQGLYAASGSSAGSVTLGFAAGSVALVVVFVAFYRYGARVPLRPFFIATSALLYYLAVSFMGAGLHELQEAGVLPTTVVEPLADLFYGEPWLARVAGLVGVYPTVETLLGQGALLLAGAGGLVYALAIDRAPARVRPVRPNA